MNVHSALNSRMNRIEGMRFTRNRQNTRSLGKFLAGNPTLKCVCRYSSSRVTSDSVSRSKTCRSVLFEIEIPCILLFLNRNMNSQNSPKTMHPQFIVERKLVGKENQRTSYNFNGTKLAVKIRI